MREPYLHESHLGFEADAPLVLETGAMKWMCAIARISPETFTLEGAPTGHLVTDVARAVPWDHPIAEARSRADEEVL